MGAVSVLDVTATRQFFESNEIDARWSVNIAALTVKPPTEYHVDLLAPDGTILANKLVPGGSFALFNGVKNERVQLPYKREWGPAKNLRVRVESWEKTIGWHKTSERTVAVRDGLLATRPQSGESVISELTPDLSTKAAVGGLVVVAGVIGLAVVLTQGASLARSLRPPPPS